MKKSEIINKIRKSGIFQLFSLLLVLAVLAGIGAGIAVIKHRMDYEDVATKYFSAYLRDDEETMYEYVAVDESEYINYDQFALLIASERASISISEYKFSEPEKKNGKIIYTVTFENEISEEEETYTIELTKYRKKWYYLIPEYKVCIDDKIISNVSVTIPEGTELYIDDQPAGNKISDEETGTDIYDIPYMFIGEHTFYVESEFGESTVIQEVEEDNTTLMVAVEDISMKESDKSTLIAKAGEIIEAFYENAMDKDTSYKDIKSYFPDDSALLKKVKKYFNATRDILYWDSLNAIDSYKIIDLTLGDIEYELDSFEYPNKAEITCTFRYEYTASTDTTTLSSYTEQYSGSCKTKIRFIYEATDEDGWVMTGIKMSNKES